MDNFKGDEDVLKALQFLGLNSKLVGQSNAVEVLKALEETQKKLEQALKKSEKALPETQPGREYAMTPQQEYEAEMKLWEDVFSDPGSVDDMDTGSDSDGSESELPVPPETFDSSFVDPLLSSVTAEVVEETLGDTPPAPPAAPAAPAPPAPPAAPAAADVSPARSGTNPSPYTFHMLGSKYRELKGKSTTITGLKNKNYTVADLYQNEYEDVDLQYIWDKLHFTAYDLYRLYWSGKTKKNNKTQQHEEVAVPVKFEKSPAENKAWLPFAQYPPKAGDCDYGEGDADGNWETIDVGEFNRIFDKVYAVLQPTMPVQEKKEYKKRVVRKKTHTTKEFCEQYKDIVREYSGVWCYLKNGDEEVVACGLFAKKDGDEGYELFDLARAGLKQLKESKDPNKGMIDDPQFLVDVGDGKQISKYAGMGKLLVYKVMEHFFTHAKKNTEVAAHPQSWKWALPDPLHLVEDPAPADLTPHQINKPEWERIREQAQLRRGAWAEKVVEERKKAYKSKMFQTPAHTSLDTKYKEWMNGDQTVRTPQGEIHLEHPKLFSQKLQIGSDAGGGSAKHKNVKRSNGIAYVALRYPVAEIKAWAKGDHKLNQDQIDWLDKLEKELNELRKSGNESKQESKNESKNESKDRVIRTVQQTTETAWVFTDSVSDNAEAAKDPIVEIPQRIFNKTAGVYMEVLDVDFLEIQYEDSGEDEEVEEGAEEGEAYQPNSDASVGDIIQQRNGVAYKILKKTGEGPNVQFTVRRFKDEKVVGRKDIILTLDELDDRDDAAINPKQADGEEEDEQGTTSEFRKGELLLVPGSREQLKYCDKTYTWKRGPNQALRFFDNNNIEVNSDYKTLIQRLTFMYGYGDQVYTMEDDEAAKKHIRVTGKQGKVKSVLETTVIRYTNRKADDGRLERLDKPAGHDNNYRMVHDKKGMLTLEDDKGNKIEKFCGDVGQYLEVYSKDARVSVNGEEGYTVEKFDSKTQMYTVKDIFDNNMMEVDRDYVDEAGEKDDAQALQVKEGEDVYVILNNQDEESFPRYKLTKSFDENDYSCTIEKPPGTEVKVRASTVVKAKEPRQPEATVEYKSKRYLCRATKMKVLQTSEGATGVQPVYIVSTDVKHTPPTAADTEWETAPQLKRVYTDEAKKVEPYASGEDKGEEEDPSSMTYARLALLQNACIEDTLFAAARWYDRSHDIADVVVADAEDDADADDDDDDDDGDFVPEEDGGDKEDGDEENGGGDGDDEEDGDKEDGDDKEDDEGDDDAAARDEARDEAREAALKREEVADEALARKEARSATLEGRIRTLYGTLYGVTDSSMQTTLTDLIAFYEKDDNKQSKTLDEYWGFKQIDFNSYWLAVGGNATELPPPYKDSGIYQYDEFVNGLAGLDSDCVYIARKGGDGSGHFALLYYYTAGAKSPSAGWYVYSGEQINFQITQTTDGKTTVLPAALDYYKVNTKPTGALQNLMLWTLDNAERIAGLAQEVIYHRFVQILVAAYMSWKQKKDDGVIIKTLQTYMKRFNEDQEPSENKALQWLCEELPERFWKKGPNNLDDLLESALQNEDDEKLAKETLDTTWENAQQDAREAVREDTEKAAKKEGISFHAYVTSKIKPDAPYVMGDYEVQKTSHGVGLFTRRKIYKKWYLASFDEFGKTMKVVTDTQQEHDEERQNMVNTYPKNQQPYLISTPEKEDEKTGEWVSFLSNPYNRQWGFMNDPHAYSLVDGSVRVKESKDGPNIEVRPDGIFAVRDIEAGTELLFEYGEDYPWVEVLRDAA